MKKRKDGRYVKKIKINNRYVYFYSMADTEKKAERDIERQLLLYKEKEENGKTVEEVLKEFENEHYKGLAYTSIHRYKSLVDHIRQFFGGEYIRKIKHEDIQKFIQRQSDLNYSTKSIIELTNMTKLVWKFAFIKGYINYNEALYVKSVKGKPKKPRTPLTEEEIAYLWEHKEEEHARFMLFCLYTGLRKGEALALQYKDISDGFINVDKTLVYTDEGAKIKKGAKTESGNRYAILPDIIIPLIGKGNKNDYVFGGKEPVQCYEYSNREKQYRKKGLKITAHRCRHDYVTTLYENDIPVKDAQILVGHSDVSTTQNIYTHIRQSRQEKTKEKINTFFK